MWHDDSKKNVYYKQKRALIKSFLFSFISCSWHYAAHLGSPENGITQQDIR